MLVPRPLDDVEWLLLTTPDDTEEAPWMVMPEFQWNIITLLLSILRRYAHERNLRWHLAADLKVVMPRAVAPRNLDLAPDLLMAEADDEERTSWNVSHEGQPPSLVLEVVTDESWERDTQEKPLLYDRMGVHEYVIFAPLRTDGPILFGYARDEEGRFVPWSTDAACRLHSAVLEGVRLYPEGTPLRVEDPDGRRMLSDVEAAEVERIRAAQEAARAQEATARAQAAEEEVLRLRALLEERGGA